MRPVPRTLCAAVLAAVCAHAGARTEVQAAALVPPMGWNPWNAFHTEVSEDKIMAAARPLYAGPGHWNDPDMLELGHGEFDAGHLVQARAHMSLWPIAAAPLILGADLTRMPQALLDVAGNRDLIAVDQDPAGHQGVTVARAGDTQAIARTLAAPGHKALALVNRGARAQRMTLPLAPHETALLLVRGRPLHPGRVHVSEVPARVQVLDDGGAALPTALAAAWIPAQVNAAPSGRPLVLDGARVDDGLGTLASARLALRLDGEFALSQPRGCDGGGRRRPLPHRCRRQAGVRAPQRGHRGHRPGRARRAPPGTGDRGHRFEPRHTGADRLGRPELVR